MRFGTSVIWWLITVGMGIHCWLHEKWTDFSEWWFFGVSKPKMIQRNMVVPAGTLVWNTRALLYERSTSRIRSSDKHSPEDSLIPSGTAMVYLGCTAEPVWTGHLEHSNSWTMTHWVYLDGITGMTEIASEMLSPVSPASNAS